MFEEEQYLEVVEKLAPAFGWDSDILSDVSTQVNVYILCVCIITYDVCKPFIIFIYFSFFFFQFLVGLSGGDAAKLSGVSMLAQSLLQLNRPLVFCTCSLPP